MDITPNDYIFKKVEELRKDDKYFLNDKIYTVIDIRYLRCRGNVHHKLRNIIFTLQCDEDKTTTSKCFRIGYKDSMFDDKMFFY
jgi:hypothetical protein